MSFTALSTGGKYKANISKSNLPDYEIGFIPAIVPDNHAQWNNGGVRGSDIGPPCAGKNNIVTKVNGNSPKNDGKTYQYGWRLRTAGGNTPLDIQQTYIVAYYWKRIN